MTEISAIQALTGDLHLHLFLVERRTITPGWWNNIERRDSFWRLYCNDREGAAVEVGRQDYPLRAGHFCIVPAGVNFRSICQGDIEHFYVHFDVIGLPSIVLGELFHKPIALDVEPREYDWLWTQVGEEQTIDAIDLRLQCEIKALLYRGLGKYLRNLPEEQLVRSWQRAKDLAVVLPALDYIEQHLGEHLTNQTLAQCCHVQKDYFIRLFRTHVGSTPVQYIQQRRVAMATQQLVFSNKSIEQISALTGFGNRYYFSRVFTRMVGMSPVAYRKQAQM